MVQNEPIASLYASQFSTQSGQLEHLIAIGYSAGGLEAFAAFLNAYQPLPKTSLILIQHGQEGAEAGLLAYLEDLTKLSVKLLETNERLRAGFLYLVPNQLNLSFKEGQVRLSRYSKFPTLKLAIDHGFKALAESQKLALTAIVFSGAGSDGAKGMKAICNAGGLCLAQDSESASYSSMPDEAAKLTSAQRLGPAAMPEYIARQLEASGVFQADALYQLGPDYEAILQVLAEKQGFDYRQYQAANLSRRLQYRLEQLKLSPEVYLKRLTLNENEQQALLESLLLVVTEFFRDTQAFDYLQMEVISKLVQEDRELRLWVAGCATGQEAYSLAICLLEAYSAYKLQPKFKIFASDISKKALKRAGQGRYTSADLLAVPESFLQSYFEPQGNDFMVKESLRKHIIFADHHLLLNPPFTRVDLISCRNLLIYFNEEARQQILARFHFALTPEGYLFLGPSESTQPFDKGFKAIEVNWKIYQKRLAKRSLAAQTLIDLGQPKKRSELQPRRFSKQQLRTELLSQIAQEGFLLNQDFHVIETFGRAYDLLSFNEGSADLSLASMLPSFLRASIQLYLRRLSQNKEASYTQLEHQGQLYYLSFSHIGLSAIEFYYFVGVHRLEALSAESREPELNTYSGKESERILALEIELERKDKQLQHVIEELETSNEELVAINEELTAANEESQAVNEELQSVNEELHTVNAEYQDKLHAVTQANNDLINLQNVAEVGIIFLDKHLRVRSYSPMLAKRFNMFPQDIGRRIEYLTLNLKLEPRAFRAILDRVIEAGTPQEFEAYDANDTPYWLRIMPYLSSEGQCDGAVMSLTEITQLKQTQKRLEEKHRFSENLIAATPGINYIYTFGKGRTSFAGNSFPKVLGYTTVDESSNPSFLLDLMHADDKKRLDEHNQRLQLSKSGEAISFEFRVRHAKGHWVWLETRETVHHRDKEGKMLQVLGIALDISSRKHIEERLQYDALHDGLTGLRNRIAFIEHLEQAHRDFLRYPDQNYAVLFVDLDRFKAINDGFGHVAGDFILKVVAQRLKEHFREADIVARHSGDEFLILLKHIVSEKETETLARTLIERLEQPISFNDNVLEISASVGIAMANPQLSSAESLIGSADIAMYKSKADNGSSVHVFDDTLHLESQERFNLELELRQALRDRKLRVYYQPIVDARTGETVALEALARWPQADGFVPPSKFIPLAESTGLIDKIDKSIFKQAVAFLGKLPDERIKIHLNLSAKHLSHPGIIDFLLNPEVNPERLCLEITESQLFTREVKTLELLGELGELGYELAIDDFGTGYSALSYLQSMPTKTLKIDRSFVQCANENDRSKKIIAAIAHLAKALDYEIVAEGVETKEQLELVKALEIDYVQGYVFAKPLSPEACRDWLKQAKLDGQNKPRA
ncbi:MAG: EAL domain-containing protein [Trueperaceae bacterium]|nr:EAL domain-containing protein [Trueperaceae bacterium]